MLYNRYMTEQLTDEASKIREVMPIEEARSSTILNGVGNGMMIGSMPFVALETYKNIAHHGHPEKNLPKPLYIASALATVGGAAWGYMNGAQEADHLNEYRLTALDEMSRLRSETTQNREKLVLHQEALLQHQEELLRQSGHSQPSWRERVASSQSHDNAQNIYR